MQYLSLEIVDNNYIIAVQEIEKLLPVTKEINSKLNSETEIRQIVYMSQVYNFIDLAIKFNDCRSKLYRGSRIILPRKFSNTAILVELACQLHDLELNNNDHIVIEGKHYTVLNLEKIL